jgi:hypothetical protein
VAADAATGVAAGVMGAAVVGATVVDATDVVEATDVVATASVVGAGVAAVVVAPLLEHAPRTNAATTPRSSSRRVGMRVSSDRVVTHEVSAEVPGQARAIAAANERNLDETRMKGPVSTLDSGLAGPPWRR